MMMIEGSMMRNSQMEILSRVRIEQYTKPGVEYSTT